MENNYKVYKHTCPSGKIYIGITQQKVNKRWDKGRGYKGNDYFTKAINKYGWENIKHEILYENLNKEEAENKEIELINLYKSNDRKFGYNIENGGSTIGKHSEEVKEKMALIKEKETKDIINLETKEVFPSATKAAKKYNNSPSNILLCCKGERIMASGFHWMFYDDYKNKTEHEIKSIISKVLRNQGKVICIETKEIFDSIKEAANKYKINQFHLAECCKGNDKTCGGYHWIHYNKYLKMNEDDILKYIDNKVREKYIICLETKEIFKNAKEAAQYYGIDGSAILKCCKGKLKTTGKKHWQYYEEYLKQQ